MISGKSSKDTMHSSRECHTNPMEGNWKFQGGGEGFQRQNLPSLAQTYAKKRMHVWSG